MAKYVSRFTGQEIDQRLAEVEQKWGAAHFNSMRMEWIGFKNEEDKAEWLATGDDSLIVGSPVPFSFSGTVNQVKVVNEMSSKDLYFTTQSTEVLLTCSFISQEKGITDTIWNDVNEDFEVTVSVDKGSAGTFVDIITGKTILNGNSFTFDVGKYLATGANRVRVQARGLLTGYKGAFTYSVTLTTMYISPSKFAWNNAFIEGTTYSLGGLNIGGYLNKSLKVRVTRDDVNESKRYFKEYTEVLGNFTAINNAYFFKKLVFPDKGTGVYHVEIWLDANGLESDHLHYNIMCVALADVNTAKLVCVNDIATDVTNGSDAPAIVKYAVYNGKESLASPYFEITKDGTILSSGTEIDIPVQSKQNLSASIDTESEEVSFEIQAMVQLGGSSQTATITIDNSKSFPSVKGAVFYMNAVNRTNSQENKNKIVNEVDGREYAINATNIAYADGTDGHTVDENGRKCMLIPATCLMNIGYRPMAQVSEGSGEDVGWTFELLYKVANAADYNENVITISPNPTDDKFQGLVIKPKNVCLHSRDLYSNDLAQSYNTKDNEIVHLVVTIIKGYKTNYGNLAQIYVNGVKKTSFAYQSSDSFSVTSNIIMGSQTADLYVYKMRVYNQGFEWHHVIQNFINCLPSKEERTAIQEQIKSVTDDSYNISYDAVVGKRNTMVIEMKDGAILPDNLHPNGGKCNVTFDFPDVIDSEMDDDFKRFFSGVTIENETIEGQGTTAMTYFRWNFRWKLSSKYNKRRITAKKNVASSMHSHKMGATRMYNNLHRAVCGANEVGKRVAVYQYPAYGFLKTLKDGTTDQYDYTFIGLYTVGPDKGDKPTFGYDNKNYKDSIIHLEGTDHTPKSVGFDYPWDAISYSSSDESIGAFNEKNVHSKAWEVGAAGKWETGLYQEYEDGPTLNDEAEVQNMLNNEFKPAYNVVYNNSTSILGVSETLDEINANPIEWRKKIAGNGKSYSDLEFYTDGVYDLYYYNEQEQIFKSNGINLLTDLGITKDSVISMDSASRLEFFKQKRRDRFKADFPNYWNLNDSLFHESFCELFGVSDNFKKNNYPYKFALLADGGRWRKRQDDLDTIFDINNQGFASKLYSILLGDQTGAGSVFVGEDSNFTILISECYAEEKKNMIHRIFDTMASLSPYGQFSIEKLVGFVQYCCWDWAQNYFVKSAYNSDAEWTYEEAWPLHSSGDYKNDVNPLSQSLGDHFEAEKDWIELRMVFMASYYNWGAFAMDMGDDKSTGQISFRASSGSKVYTITPALDHNPTILVGQNNIAMAGRRVKAGETVEVTVPDIGSNDTYIFIQGADYLADLGDLRDIQLYATNPNLNVASKRLRRLKLGGETGVTSNIRTLTIGNCPSMEEVNAQNLSQLSETVNLSQCPRLKKALFSGTQVANVVIASGSKIIQLSLPGTLTTLSLVKLLNLTEENLIFDNLNNIAYLRLENNAHMDGWEMLKNAYANSDKLTNIRVVGFDHVGDSSDIDMISSFVTTLNEAGYRKYNGINDNGVNTTDLPVLDGKLVVNTPVYGDTLAIVKQNYPQLKITASKLYIRFTDSEVQRIVAENWGDGTGITLEQAESVTEIKGQFRDNLDITNFNEFEKFIGVKSIRGDVSHGDKRGFGGCENLKSIILPIGLSIENGSYTSNTWGAFAFTGLEFVGNLDKVVKIGNYAFRSCINLSYSGEYKNEDVLSIGTNSFENCGNFNAIINVPNLTSIGSRAFDSSGITKIGNLGKITSIPDGSHASDGQHGVFALCNNLTEVNFPSTLVSIGAYAFFKSGNLRQINNYNNVTNIGQNAFYDCTTLEIEDLSLPNLETLGQNAFYGVKIRKISNLGKLTALPAATTNTQNFGDKSVLEEVVLPTTLTSIPSSCFSGYKCAISVDLSSVLSIGSTAFYRANFTDKEINLQSVQTLGGAAFAFSNITKVLSLGEVTEIAAQASTGDYLTGQQPGVFAGCSSLTSVILPPTLKKIGVNAFANCSSLTDMVLPNGLEVLDLFALKGCPQLRIDYLPESITTIGTDVFYENANMPDDVVLPNLTGSIGGGAFAKTNIKRVLDLGNIIGTGVSSVYWPTNNGAGTFAGCVELELLVLPSSLTSIQHALAAGCTSLKAVVLEATTPPTLGNNCFMNTNNCPIYVPDESVEAYKTTSNWSNYADRIYPISVYNEGGVSNIIEFADPAVEALCLSNWDNNKDGYLMRIEAAGVTSLGTVFKSNTEITSFDELNEFTGLTSIANNAFYGCTNLNSVSLPESVTHIGEMAFRESSLLNCNLVLKNITVVEPGAFYKTKVRSIIMPDVVTVNGAYSEGYRTFAQCANLEYVLFGKNVTSIAPYIFSDSRQNTIIVLAETPPTFNGDSFGYSGAVQSIYVPDNSETTYEGAQNWSRYASMIKPLSQLATDNPSLYEEISEYL